MPRRRRPVRAGAATLAQRIDVFAVTTFALLTLVAAAAWFDARVRRIPNRLTIPGLAIGLLLRTADAARAATLAPLLSGFGAVAVVFVLSFPLFAVRGLGGGDVKLLLAVAAFLGLERIGPALLASAVAGAVMALAWAVRRGAHPSAIGGARGLALYSATLGRLGARPDPATSTAIPYGVAIALGTSIAWLR
jgi:prepilin peptidase CpaA